MFMYMLCYVVGMDLAYTLNTLCCVMDMNMDLAYTRIHNWIYVNKTHAPNASEASQGSSLGRMSTPHTATCDIDGWMDLARQKKHFVVSN